MILITEWSVDGSCANCLCEACRESVGWVETDCVVKMTNRGEHLFCMDCEGNSDTIPALLMPIDEECVFIRSEKTTDIIVLRVGKTAGYEVYAYREDANGLLV